VNRWVRISFAVLGVAQIASGTVGILRGGETGVNVTIVVLGVFWLTIAALEWRGIGALDRYRYPVEGGPQINPRTERNPEV
jgi:hypothetical protein